MMTMTREWTAKGMMDDDDANNERVDNNDSVSDFSLYGLSIQFPLGAL